MRITTFLEVAGIDPVEQSPGLGPGNTQYECVSLPVNLALHMVEDVGTAPLLLVPGQA